MLGMRRESVLCESAKCKKRGVSSVISDRAMLYQKRSEIDEVCVD